MQAKSKVILTNSSICFYHTTEKAIHQGSLFLIHEAGILYIYPTINFCHEKTAAVDVIAPALTPGAGH